MGFNTDFNSKVCPLFCRNHPRRCSLTKYNVASIVGHLFHLKHNRWLCEGDRNHHHDVLCHQLWMMKTPTSDGTDAGRQDMMNLSKGSGSYNWLEIFFSQYSRPRSFQWSFISKWMPQSRRCEGLIKKHEGAQSIILESQTDSRAVSASWCISGIKSIKTL